MIRAAIAGVQGVVILAALAWAVTAKNPAGYVIAAYAALALVAVFVDRGRYRPADPGPSQPAATGEWNVDPVTGQTQRIYVDTRTGRRSERPEPPPGAAGGSPPAASVRP